MIAVLCDVGHISLRNSVLTFGSAVRCGRDRGLLPLDDVHGGDYRPTSAHRTIKLQEGRSTRRQRVITKLFSGLWPAATTRSSSMIKATPLRSGSCACSGSGLAANTWSATSGSVDT
jgi:hypothetical protein